MPKKRTPPSLLAAQRAQREDQERAVGLRARLNWLYGPERAAKIMADEDEAARADLTAWDRIGHSASVNQLAEVIGPAIHDA